MFKKCILIFLFILLLMESVWAQSSSSFLTPSENFNKARFTSVLAGQVVFYSVSMFLLHKLWYKKHSSHKFHFFNDNREWMQMDKLGHMTTAYNIGRLSYSTFAWSGVEDRHAALLGGSIALLFLTTIETFDGYSDGWGFSYGDMIANVTGASLLVSQQYIWNQQPVTLKFSYHRSIYPKYRPDELGRTRKEQWLKDYNAQTYWINFNIPFFVPVGNEFPKWLDLSLGYGADGMVGGHKNPVLYDSSGNELTFRRYRQYYMSFNADLTRVSISSPYYKTLAPILNIYKTPFPCMEYNSLGKIKFHALNPR